MTTEELLHPRWKTILPNYEVSEHGEVRNLKTGKLLKWQKSTQGYAYVCPSVNGVNTKLYNHRAVAEAFLPNPDNLPQVNHLDGDKFNPALENLEWTTVAGNHQHAHETGLSANGHDHYKAKVSEGDYTRILRLHGEGYQNGELARMFGVAPSTIMRLLKGISYQYREKYLNKSKAADLNELRYRVSLPYPFSPYDVGEIVTPANEYQAKLFEDNNSIFKKLEWWEERAPDDLPLYVRFTLTGDVHQMQDYQWSEGYVWLQRSIHEEPFKACLSWAVPASDSEYSAFKLGKTLAL